jgi:hypothetical protein
MVRRDKEVGINTSEINMKQRNNIDDQEREEGKEIGVTHTIGTKVEGDHLPVHILLIQSGGAERAERAGEEIDPSSDLAPNPDRGPTPIPITVVVGIIVEGVISL